MPYAPGKGKPYPEQGITKDELAVIYASLILADDDVPITAEKIETILAAAEVEVKMTTMKIFSLTFFPFYSRFKNRLCAHSSGKT